MDELQRQKMIQELEKMIQELEKKIADASWVYLKEDNQWQDSILPPVDGGREKA